MSGYYVCQPSAYTHYLMASDGGIHMVGFVPFPFPRARFCTKREANAYMKVVKVKYPRDKFFVLDEDGVKRIMIARSLRG